MSQGQMGSLVMDSFFHTFSKFNLLETVFCNYVGSSKAM